MVVVVVMVLVVVEVLLVPELCAGVQYLKCNKIYVHMHTAMAYGIWHMAYCRQEARPKNVAFVCHAPSPMPHAPRPFSPATPPPPSFCWGEPDTTATTAYSRLGLPANLTNERLRVLPKREKLKVERR